MSRPPPPPGGRPPSAFVLLAAILGAVALAAFASGGGARIVEVQSGAGVPDGILLVRRADGSETATPIGCYQPISPRRPPDCP